MIDPVTEAGHPHTEDHDLPEARPRDVEVRIKDGRIRIKVHTRCSVCDVFIDMGIPHTHVIPRSVRGWRSLVTEVFGELAAAELSLALANYVLDAGNLRTHLVKTMARPDEPACGKAPIINRTTNPRFIDCDRCKSTKQFRETWEKFRRSGELWAQEDPQ